ncbi:MAG TPA: hypothetical protein VGT78_05880 [Rhizomicrobium sp.]|nr:hypothetical protein [Rhizomicrobium sp.]
MGVARLLAKAWVVFCLFAGAHALNRALGAHALPVEALQSIGVAVFLFGAMGLLFIGGFGASSAHGGSAMLARLKPTHIAPGFNEIVFIAFAALSFFVQTAYLPEHVTGGILGALQAAIGFAVPGQHALTDSMARCGLDGGRTFAAAFSWLLALIFLGSALSRIRLAAGIVRLERKSRPEAMGAAPLAFILGVSAVVGIQLLYVGSAFALVPCNALGGIPGDLLIGLAPLMLAYLIEAALANLLALNPEA